MAAVVELHHHAPEGGGVDRADAEAVGGRLRRWLRRWLRRRPAPVLVLARLQVIEHRRAIRGPAVAPGRVVVEAEDVAVAEEELGVIEVRQLVPAELDV